MPESEAATVYDPVEQRNDLDDFFGEYLNNLGDEIEPDDLQDCKSIETRIHLRRVKVPLFQLAVL